MQSIKNSFIVKHKIWIENQEGEGLLGDGRWKLLMAIQETGSLKLAMDKLNLSYRKTWNNLQKLEELLGFEVVQTSRGGKEKGSSTLTPKGILLVKAYENYHAEFDILVQEKCKKFTSELNNLMKPDNSL